MARGAFGSTSSLRLQPKHPNIDAAIEDVFVASGRLQQMLARKRSPRRIEEGQQQGVLAFAQGNWPFLRIGQTPAATIKSPSVEPVFALLDIVGAHGPSVLTAPQHSAIPGIQFADAERLGQAVVGTEFESDHTVNFFAGTTCQNNDWDVRTGTNFPEQIEPIVLAETQLENDRTWVLASQLTPRCQAAGRRDGLYAVLPEIIRDQVPYGRIVIHDKDTA